MIGQTIIYQNVVFQVTKYLGKGKSGYSYLIENKKDKYVLKKIHLHPCSYYQFGDKLASEIHAYQILKKIGVPVPRLYEFDALNQYLIKEYIAGPTVAQLVAENKIKEKHFQEMFKLTALIYAKGINIDYFPTNYIIDRLGEENERLVYVDYEYNSYSEEWNFEHWGIYYWLNQKGMHQFLKTGYALAINSDPDSGKPIKKGLEEKARSMIAQFS